MDYEADYEPTEEDYKDWVQCLADRDAEEQVDEVQP